MQPGRLEHAIGAGAGLIVGAIFGAVDAASSADRVMSAADYSAKVREQRSQRQLTLSLGYGVKF